MGKRLLILECLILPLLITISCGIKKQSFVEKTPQRIISLAPSITETLFALGLGGRVVGVTSYCIYPPEVRKIEKIGSYSDANIEKIVSLHPDLVILTREHSHQKESLERFNVRTLTVDHSDCSNLCSSFVSIGSLCNVKGAADSLVTLFKMSMNTEKASETLKPKILLCIGRESPGSGTIKSIFSVGTSTIYNEIIEAAGGINAFRDSFPMYPALSYEGMIALQPDIIIDAAATMGDFDCDKLAGDWKSLSRVKAVQQKKIYCNQKDYATVPGPRVLLLVDDFRKVVNDATGKIKE